MNLNDFMLLLYTFIIIILIIYIMLKKHDIIYKYTGIDVLNIYNSIKTNLDKVL
jgi:hypothetical protein